MNSRQPRPIAAPARLAALLVIGWIATAASLPDPADTMSKVARDLGLQTQMPRDEAPVKAPPPSDFHWHIPAGVAEAVLVGALVIGLGFAAYALRDTVPSFSRRTRAKPEPAVILPFVESVGRMHETGDDADDLARRGLFAEAMHMLLLRSLTELRRRLDVSLADSLTSREILQRLGLPDPGRHALADLIRRVEFVHFGRQVATALDYAACRASYERLIGTMRKPLASAA